ncbi:MAG: YHS domain-containing protein [Phycisphaerae bacterium]|nr:YHS domain-containing protein [Phycisphaerae bacterium]
MKAKGLMLLTVAMLTVAVTFVGCKKKEPPAPAAKEMRGTTAEAGQAKEELDRVAKEAQEAIKKMEDLTEQTTCPVMDGNKINKDVFVEYKGVKVYFCCDGCKAKFEADPEKYTANLPQFQK